MAPQPQPNDLRQSNGTGQEDSETGVLFPLEHLAKLDDQLNRPKWVVPVRPDDDLERLLKASIKLCREGGFESYSIVLEFIYMYVGGRVQQFLWELLKMKVMALLTGQDVNCEPCQRFFREGLTTSFIRILTDDAVSTWKPDIQVTWKLNLIHEYCNYTLVGVSEL